MITVLVGDTPVLPRVDVLGLGLALALGLAGVAVTTVLDQPLQGGARVPGRLADADHRLVGVLAPDARTQPRWILTDMFLPPAIAANRPGVESGLRTGIGSNDHAVVKLTGTCPGLDPRKVPPKRILKTRQVRSKIRKNVELAHEVAAAGGALVAGAVAADAEVVVEGAGADEQNLGTVY